MRDEKQRTCVTKHGDANSHFPLTQKKVQEQRATTRFLLFPLTALKSSSEHVNLSGSVKVTAVIMKHIIRSR